LGYETLLAGKGWSQTMSRLRCLLYLLAAGALLAQAPQTLLKGIWEPVSYPQDLRLTDVFFVTAEVGWASGYGGTILGTRDGGKTWTPQLGGDPRSQQPPIVDLLFLDERHGWATVQGVLRDAQLFRTTDGKNWEQVGVIPRFSEYTPKEYTFTSPAKGFAVNGDDGFIRMTQDAGKSWREVFQCRAKANIQGLTREVGCGFISVHFPTPSIGYALGSPGVTPDSVFLAKTADGGLTWTLGVAEGPAIENGLRGKVLFSDENNGLISTSHQKIYATTDGGKSWRGMPGTLASWDFQLADPEVGWAFHERDSSLSFTADGGRRWSSLRLSFPTPVRGFSLPRRDRAYVVGDHGMIYRYRVVPMDYTAANAFDAPAMPGVEPHLLELSRQAQAQVELLAKKLNADAQPSGGGADKPLVDTCCLAETQTLGVTVAGIGQNVPAVGRKYRNLNLIPLGRELMSDLSTHASGLSASFAELRKAPDKQSALATLARMRSSASSVTRTAQVQFQQPGASMTFAASGAGSAGGAKTAGIVLEPLGGPVNPPAANANPAAAGSKTPAHETKTSVEEKVRRLKQILRPKLP